MYFKYSVLNRWRQAARIETPAQFVQSTFKRFVACKQLLESDNGRNRFALKVQWVVSVMKL